MAGTTTARSMGIVNLRHLRSLQARDRSRTTAVWASCTLWPMSGEPIASTRGTSEAPGHLRRLAAESAHDDPGQRRLGDEPQHSLHPRIGGGFLASPVSSHKDPDPRAPPGPPAATALLLKATISARIRKP